MAVIKINGVALPNPSNLQIVESDFHSEDTGRNEMGYAFVERVRADVFKAEGLEWRGLTNAEITQIKEATNLPVLEIEIFTERGMVKKTFYRGDRRQSLINNKTSNPRWSLTMPLTEV